MALLGSSVDPRLFMQDYSGFTRAAEIQAQGMQNLGAAIGQGIKDFGEARQERKKLDAQIKADSASIESAMKLGDSLGIDIKSYLAPIQAKINDPNTTPMEAAAYGRAAAQGISNAFTLGIGAQDRATRLQQAGIEQQLRIADLEIKGRRADIAEQTAIQGAKPTFDLQKATITSPDGETFEMDIPYDKKKGMFFDPDAGKYIKDVNKWGFGEPSYVEGEAMPTPTSQNEIIAPSTAYSFGKAVGGPDELQDKWTNKGYTSTGPNLVEGVVAVNTNKYPLGTIFKDSESGKVYVAADRHGNKDSSVIDFFQNPENYTGGKVNKRLSIIGAVPKNKIPKTKEGMSQLIEQYSNVPDYSTSSNASQIDNAISMGGDMTQQAMGTPQQQAEIARMIEEEQSMQTAQAVPQGAMGTEPSIATQQSPQARPQLRPRSGFVPVRPQGQAQFRQATPEEVATYGTQGQVNTATGEFRPIRPPSGMVIEQTKDGGFRVVQGAGAVGRQEQAAQAAKEQGVERATMGTQEIGRALKVLDSGVMQGSGPLASFYRAGASKFVKGTPEYKLANDFIAPIKSMLAFNELNKMRMASPTGGALGNVAKFETDMLQQSAGQLDIDKTDPQTLRENLMRLQEKYLDVIHGSSEQRRKLLQEGKITKEQYFDIESSYPAFTMSATGETVPRQMEGVAPQAQESEADRILRELGE
jgi:hypothetical protein